MFNKIGRRALLGVFIGLVGIWLIFWGLTLLRPISNTAAFDRLRAELPKAQARWEEANITSYKVTVLVFTPACMKDVRLSIRNNQRVEATTLERETRLATPYPKATISSEFWSTNTPNCSLDEFVFSQMFKAISSALAKSKPNEWLLDARFEAQFGYPAYFLAENCAIEFSCARHEYQFEDFQPTTP